MQGIDATCFPPNERAPLARGKKTPPLDAQTMFNWLNQGVFTHEVALLIGQGLEARLIACLSDRRGKIQGEGEPESAHHAGEGEPIRMMSELLPQSKPR